MVTFAIPRSEILLYVIAFILVICPILTPRAQQGTQIQGTHRASLLSPLRSALKPPAVSQTVTARLGTVSYRVASHSTTDPYLAGAISLAYLEPTTILKVSCRVLSISGTRWHVNAEIDGVAFDLGAINSRGWLPADPRCLISFETKFADHTSGTLTTAEQLLQRSGSHTISITLTTDSLDPNTLISLDRADLVVQRTNITKQLIPLYIPCMPVVSEKEVCSLSSVPLPLSDHRRLTLQEAKMTKHGFRRRKLHSPKM